MNELGELMTLDTAFARLRQNDENVPKPTVLPSVADVDAVEHELGLRFHPDYRRFLLEVSNVVVGVLEPATISSTVLAYRDLPRLARRGWNAGVPRSQLPICLHNGDFYIIDSSGHVSFWCHDDESNREIGDLSDWIDEWLADD